MPSPGHHWWDETRRERAALWSHVFMDLCTRVANGQNPSHRVRSRRRASLRGDRFVELSAHKPLGRQPCCVAMSPGALVFHGSSRERESLLGADTMLLFVPGYRIRDPGSPTFVPRTRGYRPRRWRPACAQTACSGRNNARITSRCNARSHALSAVARTV